MTELAERDCGEAAPRWAWPGLPEHPGCPHRPPSPAHTPPPQAGLFSLCHSGLGPSGARPLPALHKWIATATPPGIPRAAEEGWPPWPWLAGGSPPTPPSVQEGSVPGHRWAASNRVCVSGERRWGPNRQLSSSLAPAQPAIWGVCSPGLPSSAVPAARLARVPRSPASHMTAFCSNRLVAVSQQSLPVGSIPFPLGCQ